MKKNMIRNHSFLKNMCYNKKEKTGGGVMQKKISVKLLSSDEKIAYDVIGDFSSDDSELYYEEEDMYKTSVIYNFLTNVLKRDNREMYLEYNFAEEEGKVLIKDLDQEMYLDLQVEKINKTKNTITIKYKVNGIDYKYSIRIKEEV
ncbi:MAG: hypothetical protein IJH13_04145 [Bacilli bacterium]|nr:hypothetical protein [Bacilli bacterium]